MRVVTQLSRARIQQLPNTAPETVSNPASRFGLPIGSPLSLKLPVWIVQPDL